MGNPSALHADAKNAKEKGVEGNAVSTTYSVGKQRKKITKKGVQKGGKEYYRNQDPTQSRDFGDSERSIRNLRETGKRG